MPQCIVSFRPAMTIVAYLKVPLAVVRISVLVFFKIFIALASVVQPSLSVRWNFYNPDDAAGSSVAAICGLGGDTHAYHGQC